MRCAYIWTLKSIPELADLPWRARGRVWRRNVRKALIHPRVRIAGWCPLLFVLLSWFYWYCMFWSWGIDLYLLIISSIPWALAGTWGAIVYQQLLVKHTRPYLRKDRETRCPVCDHSFENRVEDKCSSCGQLTDSGFYTGVAESCEDEIRELRRPIQWRFSLRLLLVLVSVFCVFAALAGLRLNSIHSQKRIISKYERDESRGIHALYEFGDVIKAEPSGTFANEDLLELCELPRLEMLFLEKTQVDSDGLVHIGRLQRLEWLILRDLDVTDEGLKWLSNVTTLRKLDLDGTHITDKGLECLRELTNLEQVSVRRTAVTIIGLERLRDALPNAIITSD